MGLFLSLPHDIVAAFFVVFFFFFCPYETALEVSVKTKLLVRVEPSSLPATFQGAAQVCLFMDLFYCGHSGEFPPE